MRFMLTLTSHRSAAGSLDSRWAYSACRGHILYSGLSIKLFSLECLNLQGKKRLYICAKSKSSYLFLICSFCWLQPILMFHLCMLNLQLLESWLRCGRTRGSNDGVEWMALVAACMGTDSTLPYCLFGPRWRGSVTSPAEGNPDALSYAELVES